MAKCPYCHKDMLTAPGCDFQHVRINGKEYKRIKVGDPGDFYEGKKEKTYCGDCGAQVGYYHHPECDLEVSPLDGEQLFFNCEGYYR